ncbi:hypothetical protein [Hafnia paralvei]|uniref:hypothetical protein n=1 Tax=Hafnia paralvei TaxID=546367 RepID=UPI003CD0CB59
MPLIRNAFKRLHYPVDIIVQCVRWYLAYALSLRNLEEMMAERGIIVDHSRLHRWVIRLVPLLDKAFRCHKRNVAVGGVWMKSTSKSGDSGNICIVRWILAVKPSTSC